MYNLIFILAGLIYSLKFWWFAYSTLICVIAGLGIILPLILKINIFSVLKNVVKYKKIIFYSLIINFVLRPLMAVLIGKYLFHLDLPQLKWLILLSIIPWWGLLLYWVKKSWGDTAQAFLLFLINLVVFSLIYYLTSDWWILSNSPSAYVCTFDELGVDYISCFNSEWGINPLAPLMVLIVIPLLLAGILEKYFYKFLANKEKILSYISKFFTWVVLFYIFGLKDVGVFLKNNFGESLFYLYPVASLYLAVLIVLLLVVKNTSSSLFWIGFTRFVMLWVFFVLPQIWVGGEQVLIMFLWAFVVQIVFNILISTFWKWKSG